MALEEPCQLVSAENRVLQPFSVIISSLGKMSDSSGGPAESQLKIRALNNAVTVLYVFAVRSRHHQVEVLLSTPS